MPYVRRVAAAAVVVPLALAGAPGAGASASDTPKRSATMAAHTPRVKVALTYKRVGKKVTMKVALAGYVYAPIDEDGRPIPADSPATIDIGLGQDWTWGDGSIPEGTDGGGVHCGRPHRLVRLKDDVTLTKRYRKAGTYTFAYSFLACGLKGGKVSASLPVTIP